MGMPVKNRVEIVMPRDMTPAQVAEVLNVYLIGGLVYENRKDDNGQRIHGPFKKHSDSELHWQLDPMNDFWMHVEGETAWLNCRWGDHEPTLQALAALFDRQYVPRNQKKRAA